MWKLWQKTFVWSSHHGWTWNGEWRLIGEYPTEQAARLNRAALCGNNGSYLIL